MKKNNGLCVHSQNEQEVRTRVFKLLSEEAIEELPKELIKAYADMDKAYADWKKAAADRDKADADWDKAYADMDKACVDWEGKEKWHEKYCGCKEWNGKELVF